MKRFAITIIPLILILVGCGGTPSESVIQTAIAQTAAAAATDHPTLTNTPETVLTLAPTSTATATVDMEATTQAEDFWRDFFDALKNNMWYIDGTDTDRMSELSMVPLPDLATMLEGESQVSRNGEVSLDKQISSLYHATLTMKPEGFSGLIRIDINGWAEELKALGFNTEVLSIEIEYDPASVAVTYEELDFTSHYYKTFPEYFLEAQYPPMIGYLATGSDSHLGHEIRINYSEEHPDAEVKLVFD
jgi:hypothetical protein